MPITHSCRTCGGAVPDAALASGQAVRRGQEVYCPGCAARMKRAAASPAPGPAPGSAPAPVGAEEYEILAAPPDPPAARLSSPKSTTRRGTQFLKGKAASSSGRAETVRRPSAAGLPVAPRRPPASSQRLAAVSPARPGGPARAGDSALARGARRLVPLSADSGPERRPLSADSGTKRASRPGEPEDSGPAPRESGTSASSIEPSADAKKRNQLILIVSISAGAILLLVLAVLFFGGGPRPKPNKAPAAAPAAKADLGPPPEGFIKAAKELEAKGDKLGAREQYLKAAEALDKRGRDEEALFYNQQAMRLGKAMTLPEFDRGK